MKAEKFKPSEFAETLFSEHGHVSKGWVKPILEDSDHPDYFNQLHFPFTICDRCGAQFEDDADRVFVRINGRWRASYLKKPDANSGLYDEKAIHDATCDDLIVHSVIK